MFGCFFLDPCRAFENLCVYFTVHVPPRAFISGKKHPMGVYLWKETPSAVHAPPRAFISGKKHPRVFLLWQEHPGRLIYTHSPVWALQVALVARRVRLRYCFDEDGVKVAARAMAFSFNKLATEGVDLGDGAPGFFYVMNFKGDWKFLAEMFQMERYATSNEARIGLI